MLLTAGKVSALEDGILPGEFDILLSPTSWVTKKQAEKQAKCFEAGECAERKTFYSIECAREDVECLQRKRTLANREWSSFFEDPFSSPILLFAAIFTITPWITLSIKTLRGEGPIGFRSEGDDLDPPPPPSSPPAPASGGGTADDGAESTHGGRPDDS